MEGILDCLAHRGPDARASVPLPELDGVLGHTRLSVIDLDPRSNQPFMSDDGRYIIVYNGELYNYRDLRKTLQRQRVQLRTESDTEVLLLWLVREGTTGLQDLDGMFAFGLLDRETATLVLARDRLGEKPLYWTETGEATGFAFCSEMRGLIDLPGVKTSLDEEALRNYLRFLYTPAPGTLYSGIRELEPGCVMKVDLRRGTRSKYRYYDLETAVARREPPGPPDCYQAVRECFDVCLGRRLEADVPISVYFSGGVDSSLVAGGVAGRSDAPPVETFTVRYRGSRQSEAADESRPARRLADTWGLPNRVVDFSPDFPFRQTVHRMVDLFQHPFGNSTAVVSNILAEEVARSYKVALAGDGGDELSGGYPRYRALLAKEYLDWSGPLSGLLGRLSLMMAPLWPRLLAFGRRMMALREGVGKPPEKAFLRWTTYLSRDQVGEATGTEPSATEFEYELLELFRRNSDDPLRAASLVDLRSFIPHNLLRSADRTGMAHSLEVRVPFLSPQLVELALSLDQNDRFGWRDPKRLFRRTFGDRIPDWVWNRRKMPFNPPINDYLRNNFTELKEFTAGSTARLPDVLQGQFVEGQLSDFQARRQDNATLLWGLATLEAWLRRN